MIRRRQGAALAHVKVYLDIFIGVIQGVKNNRTQMTWHLFFSIKKLLCPNNEEDTARKYKLSLRKTHKGDTAWITKNIIMV